jgi:hypothetical protein
MLLIRIREVLGLNLGWDTNSSWSSSVLSGKFQVSTSVYPKLLPSKYLTIRHASVILLFDVT